MNQTFNYYFPEDRDMIDVSHSQTGCRASNICLASSDSETYLINGPRYNIPKNAAETHYHKHCVCAVMI